MKMDYKNLCEAPWSAVAELPLWLTKRRGFVIRLQALTRSRSFLNLVPNRALL